MAPLNPNPPPARSGLRALVRSLTSGRRAWMLPVLLVLVLLVLVLTGLSAVRYVAPFVYAVL